VPNVPAPPESPPARPSLARELLWSLSLLTGAALSLAVVTTLAAQVLSPRFAAVALLFLIGADVAVLFVFGRSLLRKLVLRPMGLLMAAADDVSAGKLDRRAPGGDTAEFHRLGERFNEMTDALLGAQTQLVRAEKLAGIGRLAAGVAHEVGNPLAAIGTYVEVLRQRGVDPEMVESIGTELERIDRIIRGLLTYARPGEEDIGDIDLADLAAHVVELLTHQGVFKGRAVQVNIEPGLAAVRGQRHRMEQVLVNLLLNAVDAATASSITVGAMTWRQAFRASDLVRRGETVRPPRRRRSGSRPWRPELTAPATSVLLYVFDSGPGVPVEDRERVFDPFFTTKAPGAGTGLGLAIVHRTVDEMGGVVWVEDAREGGAAFKILLPASVPGATVATRRAAP